MRTRYGVSPWVDNFPRTRRPDHPRLRGELTAEVAIIGGGLTGCATAYACAVAGMAPILVEADRIGQASAGRDAGLLLPEPGPSFRDVSARHGLRNARRIFESWRRASLDAAALLRRLKVPCALEPCDHITIATRDDGKVLRREYEALRAGWGGIADYDAWFAQPLNNATLASVATYTRWVPALRARLEQVGLEEFYADAAAVAELDAPLRAERLRAWENGGRTTSVSRPYPNASARAGCDCPAEPRG